MKVAGSHADTQGAATAACAVVGAWVAALGLLFYGSWRPPGARVARAALAPLEGTAVRACFSSCGRGGGTTSGPLAPGPVQSRSTLTKLLVSALRQVVALLTWCEIDKAVIDCGPERPRAAP